MNTSEVRRRLETLGAVMEHVVIVPQAASIPGWKREEKWNLVETANGYVASLFNRGQMGDRPRFDDLDEACRFVAARSKELEDIQRRYRESMGTTDEE